jgi:hypothetical protein
METACSRALEIKRGEKRDFGLVRLRAEEFVTVRLIGMWTGGAKKVWWLATNVTKSRLEDRRTL